MDRDLNVAAARAKALCKRGFTLIELLAVIVIIAVLASLLLPALARAKAQAHSIKCRSNLRQLGLQLAMYITDHGVYPSTHYVGTNVVGNATSSFAGSGETGSSLPYEQGIRRCPTRTHEPGRVAFSGDTSYGYNAYGYIGSEGLSSGQHFGLAGAAADGMYRPVSETEVRVPSDMIALGDNFALLPKSGSGLPEDTVMLSYGGLTRQETLAISGSAAMDRVRRAAARHQSQGNVVFCDGHVEAVTFRRLFLDRDDRSLRRWNKDKQPHR